jgi:hypothetical protein
VTAVDALRSGWPEQVISGTYMFRTRRRDRAYFWLNRFIEWISFGHIDPDDMYRLHIVIGYRAWMTVVHQNGDPYHHAPPGTKVCLIGSPTALLTLIWHTRFEGDESPRTWDVYDNRQDTVIGRLQKPHDGGATTISDPAGRVVGEAYSVGAKGSLSRFFGWPYPWSAQRFDVAVDDEPVATIRQRRRLSHYRYRVDVSGAAAAGLDPRLVLAVATRFLQHHGNY